MWHFVRKPRSTGPSQDALDSIIRGERELNQARELKEQFKDVGESLSRSQQMNHVGESLIHMITGRGAVQ